jgi:hypothetical protein
LLNASSIVPKEFFAFDKSMYFSPNISSFSNNIFKLLLSLFSGNGGNPPVSPPGGVGGPLGGDDNPPPNDGLDPDPPPGAGGGAPPSGGVSVVPVVDLYNLSTLSN